MEFLKDLLMHAELNVPHVSVVTYTREFRLGELVEMERGEREIDGWTGRERDGD